MKDETIRLLHSVLDSLTAVPAHTLFLGPAIDALETEELKASYRQMVAQPRDFGLIRRNLDAGAYAGIGSFQADVELCFINSKTFCKVHYPLLVKTVDGVEKAFRKALDKVLKKLETPSSSAAAAPAPAAARASRPSSSSSSAMTTFPNFEARCEALLVELERCVPGITWFTSYLDPADLPNYPLLVPVPMDLVRIRRKLGTAPLPPEAGNKPRSGGAGRYASHHDFAADVRTMLGNFLRYNSGLGMKKERMSVHAVVHRFESLWQKLATDVAAEYPALAGAFAPPVPHLKELLAAVEEGLKVPFSRYFSLLRSTPHLKSTPSPLPGVQLLERRRRHHDGRPSRRVFPLPRTGVPGPRRAEEVPRFGRPAGVFRRRDRGHRGGPLRRGQGGGRRPGADGGEHADLLGSPGMA